MADIAVPINPSILQCQYKLVSLILVTNVRLTIAVLASLTFDEPTTLVVSIMLNLTLLTVTLSESGDDLATLSLGLFIMPNLGAFGNPNTW